MVKAAAADDADGWLHGAQQYERGGVLKAGKISATTSRTPMVSEKSGKLPKKIVAGNLFIANVRRSVPRSSISTSALMDHSFRHIFRHRAIACLLGAWTAVGPLLFAQDANPDEITVIDRGQQRTLVIEDSEVYIARRKNAPLGELRGLVERVPGTKVVFDTDTRALVRLGSRIDRAKAAAAADDVSIALPDAEIEPVLYVKGAPRDEAGRRYGTGTLIVAIPVGKTLAQLAREHGAIDAQATSRPGMALLKYATPFKALHAIKELRAAGVDAQPMLAQQMQKRGAPPLDQFFPQQWHLANVGQGGGTVGIDANVLGAWEFVLGSDRTIAIVDDCLQTTHPDLTQNCPPVQTNLHHDFIDQDNDPRPGPGDQHGTACAGVAAARQNNGIPDPVTGALMGVTGSAPNARLLGLRLIAGPFTDADSALALYWHPDNNIVDVSSNSWGPIDGSGLAGPDILTKDALKQAVQLGRDGLGQVTVFAAGNGLGFLDNSNYDGFANSRYVTAVSAISNFGTQAFYSEPGANILICAPSNGGSLGITTTDLDGVNGYNPPFFPSGIPNLPNTDYTNDFGGTSSACPLVAGGVALIIESNSDLGWRDVREILAATARKVDNGDPDWKMRPGTPPVAESFINGGGFHFNHKYGAGLVDLTAAVVRARTWVNLGPELAQTVELTKAPVVNPQVPKDIPIDGTVITLPLDFTAKPNLRVEIAELKILINTIHRADLQIELDSPSGVRTVLSPQHTRPIPPGDNDLNFSNWVLDAENGVLVPHAEGWTFTSTHFWGDNSKTAVAGGAWKLRLRNFPFSGRAQDAVAAKLISASLTLYGTASPETRIVFDDGSAGDISEQGGSKTIRVRRLGPLTGEATVNYTTTIGSAIPDLNGVANPDFTPVSGTLHFSDGQVFADTDIIVPIIDDGIPELTKTVNVVLNNPTNASLGGASLFSFRILDDEGNLVSVIATQPNAAETSFAEPPQTGTFTIQRQLPSPQALNVSFTFSGTAVMGNGPNGTGDFTPVPITATIPPFATSVDVVVTPRDDNVIEGTETVVMTLNNNVNYQIGSPDSAQLNIVDNDRQKVQIGLPFSGGDLAAENPKKTTTVRVSREREAVDVPPSNPLTILLAYEGTQVNGINYQLLPDSIVIPAGADFVDMVIDPIDDTIYQATKSVIVRLRQSVDYDFQFGFLTSVFVRIIEDDPVPDTHIPVVTISEPKNKSQHTAPQPTFIASGKASDNILVNKVVFRLNNGQWQIANLATPPAQTVDWTADLLASVPAVQRGTNVLNVKSVDDDGNESKIATSTFEYVEIHKLTVAINPGGSGTVTKGFAPESQRESGHTYTVTANAASGQVFDHWSGLLAFGFASDTSSDRSLTFTMPTADVALTANFVTSPFLPNLVGSYSGIIEAPNFVSSSSGFLKVTVNPSGFYTGQIIFDGSTYKVKGDFTGSGVSNLIIPRKKDTSLIVSLHIDTADVGGTRRITGTIDSSAAVANVVADRAAYSKTNPAPAELVRNYNLIFPPANPIGNFQTDPLGNGYGTLRIGATGVVKWTGKLADGTKASQTQALTKDNTWPLFLKLYARTGVMVGNVALDLNAADSDLHGTFDWHKSARSQDRAFPAGFRIVGGSLLGSIYTAPPANTRALDFAATEDNGVILLSAGALQSDLVRFLTLDTTNKVKIRDTPADPNLTDLRVTFNAKKGTFSGKFVHPVTQKLLTLNGVLFQKQVKAFGQFLSPGIAGGITQSGAVTIQKAP
jgi:hypothetical protein